ncbi:DNA translocase FtsK 4TM domain-containing protein [Marinobacter bryozoorum]|uniref:DNA translocase FtsK n=1 Tax=Marinobacter bryozoorum TaxID=256324 RepID=UPI0020031719|nr:DNA translocase FtsK [Marinobacter bryozoorum]MCK7544677.1 DNA translocase FtsK 4TM domain-containing protein [Marinobacter bryozoorum]
MAKTGKQDNAPAELTEKQQRFRRLVAQGAREGLVIAFIALAIFLAMALATYSASDPGWASIGHDVRVDNAAGPFGAWLASLLMDVFGQVSYLFPVMVAGYALLLIRLRHDPLEMHWPLLLMRTGGFLLILLSACSLLALYSLFGLGATSGGVLGQAVSSSMVRFFNLPATTLILVAIFLFALTVTTGLSWFSLMDRVGGYTLDGLSWLRGLFSSDSTQDASQEKAPPDEKSEPPLLTEQAQVSDKEPWWRRLWPFGGKDRAGDQDSQPTKGKEDSRAGRRRSDDDEPVLLESFSSRDDDEPEPEPEPVRPAKSAGSAGKVKISPFKRDGDGEAEKEKTRKQASLLEDLESPIPPLTLLDPPDEHQEKGYSEESLEHMSRMLEEKLADFGVTVEVVEVNPGPVITRFEIKPAPGVKVSKISNLAKDLARSLAVLSVRVVEVIPGKSVVGIEIPNEKREMVRLSEVLGARVFAESSSALTLALGNDIGGNPMVANLSKMPHLLVAGTTGSGKSVGVNAMLLSMLLKATPEEVRFIMVDPKMLELSIYEGIPHLLSPVVTDMKEAANALRWCVAEMERRYKLMANLGVRNIAGYNRKVKDARAAGEPLLDPLWKPDEYLDNDEQARPELETLPFIVVVIDEFADMMMIVGKKVEELIARIAQKARAAGIHLILATQRPSVDVITGLIKANIPTRISFQVSSKIDSRTVLDQGGAEQLLGHGDMLYLPPGSGLPVRVHGAFVDDDEVHRIVNAWKARGEPDYVDDVLNGAEGESLPGVPTLSEGGDSEGDSLFDEAVAFVTEGRRVSISSVQRKFKIGYNRAANLVDAMEAAGVVSPAGHNGAREVLAPPPPKA